jgi:RHS repeat-associated protein
MLAGFLPLFRRTDTAGSPVDRVLHYDHVGNVMAESDTSGVITSTHEYDAFGRPVLSDAGTPWDPNSLHHTGKHYDADTGLFYFNARWYDAQTGRFNSANTPYQPLAEHPYAISQENPLLLIDETGLRVQNDSKITIWVKPELDDDFSVRLLPGEVYDGPQDGVFIPLEDTPVFKNVNDVDLIVKSQDDAQGNTIISIDQSSTKYPQDQVNAMQFLRGGWMTADWVHERNTHRANGTGDWNLPKGFAIR